MKSFVHQAAIDVRRGAVAGNGNSVGLRRFQREARRQQPCCFVGVLWCCCELQGRGGAGSVRLNVQRLKPLSALARSCRAASVPGRRLSVRSTTRAPTSETLGTRSERELKVDGLISGRRREDHVM